MIRATVTVLVVLSLVGPATAASTPVNPSPGDRYSLTTSPGLGASPRLQGANETNETIQRLRERVKELEDKNSRLKTKVVSKNGEIQKLKFRLNQSEKETGFSTGQAERMKELGAWDPETNAPALIITRDLGFGPVVYQYVGPGNGDHSFNGQRAWEEVAKPEEEVRKTGNFSFSLEWALPGMKEEYTVGSFGEYRVKNDELKQQLNSPAGFTAWARWTNDRRHNAETFRSETLLITFLVVGGLMYGAAWIESKQQIVLDRRKRRTKRQQGARLDGRVTGLLDRLSSVPVVGFIIEKIRRQS